MRGVPKRGLGRGRASGKATKVCTCPKCGHTEDFTRGIPCTQKECTKCGTAMKGDLCL